ncbi:hypothetical protein J480_4198 [Acinetobacter baumannii 34654]|nr:hypothetical protein J480_4198 [Acinetobacter baumannii 34654]
MEKMKEIGARLLKKVPQLKQPQKLTMMMPCSIPFYRYVS